MTGGTSLSRRLRRETRSEHVLAEATRLARAFFGGELDARAYASGLLRMAPVYASLERALSQREGEPLLRAFDRPELWRFDSVQRDLAQLAPPEPAPASAYAARIDHVADEEPVRLLGHFYVRYFADLSGGAVVGRVATRLFGLPPEMRPTYFDFPRIPDRRGYLAELRAYLDAIPARHHAAIVDEARRAFVLHRELVDALFDALARSPCTPTRSFPSTLNPRSSS